MIVLKLGGSVITDKSAPETVDAAALERAATALAAARPEPGADASAGERGEGEDGNGTRDHEGEAESRNRRGDVDDGRDGDGGETPGLVVVHGGGSFGHHHADRHGVTTDRGTRDPEALWAVHDAMRRLNDRVCEALREAGLSPTPVHPFSLAHRDRTGRLTLPVGGVAAMVAEGFVPVLHGDGVVHRGRGVTVLSGDELVVALARALDADRVGLCTTVPGVLRDGTVVERVDDLDEVRDVLGGSDGVDVTGGMAGKVDSLLGLGAPARIFGLDALPAFLAGEPVGTLVAGPDGSRDAGDRREP